ncbi:MAG: hypothetical protein ACT4OS_09505 [Acidimicrobiales bacterium]
MATDAVPWRRAGGLLGLGWALLFIAGFVLIGTIPSRGDSMAEIRSYFTENREPYLLADYLIRVAFALFFLPFVIVLRRILGSEKGWPDLLATIGLFAGALIVLWGGVASFFWGALAVAGGRVEFDDSVVRALMELDAYAFAGLNFVIGLFMGATGLSIWLGRALWRGLGIVGIVGFVVSFAGAAWPIQGDDEGVLGSLGILGFVGIVLFVVLVSINLLPRKAVHHEPPAPTNGETNRGGDLSGEK